MPQPSLINGRTNTIQHLPQLIPFQCIHHAAKQHYTPDFLHFTPFPYFSSSPHPPLYPGTLYFSDVSSTSVFMLSPILCSFSSPYLETPFCFPNRYPRMPSTPPSLAKPSPLPPAHLETLLLLFARSPTAVNPLHHLSAHLSSTPKSKIPPKPL